MTVFEMLEACVQHISRGGSMNTTITITKTHNPGRFECLSAVGKGQTFIIEAGDETIYT